MQASLDHDGLLRQLVESHRGLRVGRLLRGGGEHTGQVSQKPRILQDVIFELSLREGALAKGDHEGVGELRLPDRFRDLPQMLRKRHACLPEEPPQTGS